MLANQNLESEIHCNHPETRGRRRPRLPGELGKDGPTKDPEERFKVHCFYVTIDINRSSVQQFRQLLLCRHCPSGSRTFGKMASNHPIWRPQCQVIVFQSKGVTWESAGRFNNISRSMGCTCCLAFGRLRVFRWRRMPRHSGRWFKSHVQKEKRETSFL